MKLADFFTFEVWKIELDKTRKNKNRKSLKKASIWVSWRLWWNFWQWGRGERVLPVSVAYFGSRRSPTDCLHSQLSRVVQLWSKYSWHGNHGNYKIFDPIFWPKSLWPNPQPLLKRHGSNGWATTSRARRCHNAFCTDFRLKFKNVNLPAAFALGWITAFFPHLF